MKFTQFFSTTSHKAALANQYGWLDAINYMAPHDLSGTNLCPWSTAGCRSLCLGHYSGQAGMVSDVETGTNKVRESRVRKARYFMDQRAEYMAEMVHHIRRLERQAVRKSMRLVIRPNGSTDIPYERIRVGDHRSIMHAFPHLQFVDYTKSVDRMFRDRPANYHLVYSVNEETDDADLSRILDAGMQAAAVFAVRKNQPMPHTYKGHPVVDGDVHDLIHLQPAGTILGLRPKGRKAWADQTGFIIREF